VAEAEAREEEARRQADPIGFDALVRPFNAMGSAIGGALESTSQFFEGLGKPTPPPTTTEEAASPSQGIAAPPVIQPDGGDEENCALRNDHSMVIKLLQDELKGYLMSEGFKDCEAETAIVALMTLNPDQISKGAFWEAADTTDEALGLAIEAKLTPAEMDALIRDRGMGVSFHSQCSSCHRIFYTPMGVQLHQDIRFAQRPDRCPTWHGLGRGDFRLPTEVGSNEFGWQKQKPRRRHQPSVSPSKPHPPMKF